MLKNATMKWTETGFSYSVVTFGIFFAGGVGFFSVFFPPDFLEAPEVDAFFRSAVTIFSARLEPFF